MGVGVAGVANYVNTSSGTASDVVAYGGVGGPYEYCSFFSVLNWFLKGEPGAWYDPSDFQPNWRRNLLTYSQDFSGAGWGRANNTSSSVTELAPDNTNTATLLTNTSSANNYLNQNKPIVAGSVVTYSLNVKYSAGQPWLVFIIFSGSDGFRVWVNSNTGQVGTSSASGVGATVFNVTSTPVNNGFFRFSISGTINLTSSSATCEIDQVTTNGGYGNNIGDAKTIWGAQLEQSSSPSTYQKITDGIQDYYTVQPQPVLFQDSAGTTPVTAVEQPVGLMLDKSRGLALGAELVTNGDFSNGSTGWASSLAYTSTATVVSSELQVTSTGNYGLQVQLLPLVTGKMYKVSGYARSITGSGKVSKVGISDAIGNASIALITTTNTTTTFFSRIFTCGTDKYICLVNDQAGAGAISAFSNITIREIAGNHAFQGDLTTGAAAKRPMLSARVNLLTKTEDFSDAAWSNVGATKSTYVGILPNGLTGNITRIVISAVTNNPSFIAQFPNAQANGISLTNSVWIKQVSGGTKVGLTIESSVFGPATGNYFSTLHNVTSEWSKYTTVGTITAAAGNNAFAIGNDGRIAEQQNLPAITVDVCFPDLRPTNSGALLPPYQRVNTASDYDTVGFPLYLKANGTSSAMSTNSIDFTATDKMTVVTGVRKLSDGLMGVLETSANSGLNLQAFGIISKLSTDPTIYSVVSGGSAITAIVPSSAYSLVSPISNVLTLLSSISAPSLAVKYNGVVVGSNTVTQGTGNFGNYPLYIFARAGTTYFLNGQFYGAIIRGAQSDTASVTQTEQYMATKTGITF